MSFAQQVASTVLANAIFLFFSYLLFRFFKKRIENDPKISINSNSVESRFIRKFVQAYKGYPEISETNQILNEIKLNNVPEELWETIFKKHVWTEDLIQQRLGRGRLIP